MQENDIIFLLGLPGCGKTAIGKLLSDKLNFEFIDLDMLIRKKEEKNIGSIFREQGEVYFRGKESFYLQNLPLGNPLVISLGGGTPCFHDNMNWIKKKGTSYYLKAPAEVSARRLQNTSERPLLQNHKNENLIKKLQELLKQRESFYTLADFTVECGNDPPENPSPPSEGGLPPSRLPCEAPRREA